MARGSVSPCGARALSGPRCLCRVWHGGWSGLHVCRYICIMYINIACTCVGRAGLCVALAMGAMWSRGVCVLRGVDFLAICCLL